MPDAAPGLPALLPVYAGALLAAVGALGLLRLPDLFSRLHAAGIVDSLAAGLVLLGLLAWTGWSAASLKLLLIYAFLLFTSPVAAQSLAKAARRGSVRPKRTPES